ncbi:Ogfr, partial [Symbiodinium microadriaticum]
MDTQSTLPRSYTAGPDSQVNDPEPQTEWSQHEALRQLIFAHPMHQASTTFTSMIEPLDKAMVSLVKVLVNDVCLAAHIKGAYIMARLGLPDLSGDDLASWENLLNVFESGHKSACAMEGSICTAREKSLQAYDLKEQQAQELKGMLRGHLEKKTISQSTYDNKIKSIDAKLLRFHEDNQLELATLEKDARMYQEQCVSTVMLIWEKLPVSSKLVLPVSLTERDLVEEEDDTAADLFDLEKVLENFLDLDSKTSPDGPVKEEASMPSSPIDLCGDDDEEDEAPVQASQVASAAAPPESEASKKPGSAVRVALNRKTTTEMEATHGCPQKEGETVEQYEKRLAHNLYMSSDCPPEISQMALKSKRSVVSMSCPELSAELRVDASQTKQIMSGFYQPGSAGNAGFSVLPEKLEEVPPLEKQKPEKKARTKPQIAKAKSKDLGNKVKDANECKKSVDDSKLSQHIRDGYSKELSTYVEKLLASQSAIDETLEAKEPSDADLDRLTSEADALIVDLRNTIKTIKPVVELSYKKVRDISKELKDRYGVDMTGPSKRLADVQHAQNSQRDMLRAFPPAVPIRYVPVPMRRSMKDDAIVTRRMPLVLPHELMIVLQGRGLTSDAIRWCTLHVINLGYAGWVGASSMEYLLEKEELAFLWGGHDEGLADRLHRAYQDFTSWARARGIQWLILHVLAGTLAFAAPFQDDLLPGRYHLAELFNVMERSPRMLTEEVAERIKQLIDFSTTSYVRLAKAMVARGKLLFPLKPKLHALGATGKAVKPKAKAVKTPAEKTVEAWSVGIEGRSFVSWLRKQLREAGGFQMNAEAYKLLCDLGSDVGESLFTDMQKVMSLCKNLTADKKHLELVLDLRSWENRYTPEDADKLLDCRVQNNRLRTERAQRRLRRFTTPDAYRAPPVPEPPMFRSSSEASSRARQMRAARRLRDEGPAPPVSTASSSDAPAADPANGDAPAADQGEAADGDYTGVDDDGVYAEVFPGVGFPASDYTAPIYELTLSTPMAVLMEAYAWTMHNSVPMESVSWSLGDRLLKPEDTLASLGLHSDINVTVSRLLNPAMNEE